MGRKQTDFEIPGIHHPIPVKFVTEKRLSVLSKSKGTIGLYDHAEAKIFLAKGLTNQVRLHVLYHEIAHHIRETFNEIKDEEVICDLLSSYLIRLSDEKQKIESGLISADRTTNGRKKS